MNELPGRKFPVKLARPAVFLILSAILASGVRPAPGGQSQARLRTLLWTIGAQDRDDREFALAPGDYRKYSDEGFFVVGQSDPRRDWPYVHPGPDDAWAGSRQHNFTIVFGVRTAQAEGECALVLDLVDTHRGAPPLVEVTINGAGFHALTALHRRDRAGKDPRHPGRFVPVGDRGRHPPGLFCQPADPAPR